MADRKHPFFSQMQLNRIDPSGEQIHDRCQIEYFRYYGIHYPSIEHYFGTFESKPHTVAAHIYKPVNAESTVFLLHGYFDHSGILANLIRACLGWGFAVASFDLPGHGLSSGERASINDFSEYAAVFNDFINLCVPSLPGPYISISHSTGGAVVMEHLAGSGGKSILEKNVFLAPLVRSGSWKLSRIAFHLAGTFIKNIPRGKPDSSSDPEFIEYLAADPLQHWKIPAEWLHAMYEWNQRIENSGKLPSNALIIQGARDKTVDWRFNIPFMKKKFSSPKIIMIKTGKHHLINENSRIKTRVFSAIRDFLFDSP